MRDPETDAAYRKLDDALREVAKLTEGIPEGHIVTSWCAVVETVRYDDGELEDSTLTVVLPDGAQSPSTTSGLLANALSDRLAGRGG